MKYFETITELNQYYKLISKHSLIDIRKYSDIIPSKPTKFEPLILDFYKISFVKNFNGYMEYGDTKFMDKNGILYFLEPGQRYSCTSTLPWEGFQILIDPAIFKEYLILKNIQSYNFFSYEVNESLLLSQKEQKSVNLLMEELWNEFNSKKDKFSIPIILSYINTLLNLTERFYTRQFSKRKKMCNQLLNNFFDLLKTYYSKTTDFEIQQPTVYFFANKLNVTPNYLSDTIRHHSGKSALTIIHDFVIEEAKNKLTTSKHTVSEISYQLGFEYPNYFSRLFKRKTNLSPSDFRKSVKSL